MNEQAEDTDQPFLTCICVCIANEDCTSEQRCFNKWGGLHLSTAARHTDISMSAHILFV